MDSASGTDKTGDALKAQRFQMLEDIAHELAGDIVFPTNFDTVLKLRKVLQDRNQTLDEIAHALALDPLISVKLIHLANAMSRQDSAGIVVDLNTAVHRLGLKRVRSLATSIVMAQLLRAKGMAVFANLAQSLWEHSIRSAAAARVVACHYTHLNPDEALLAGMIHDLGAFYLLYRASQYDELRCRPDTVKYLILQWHESIGISLLNALGLPDEIVQAMEDHDREHPVPIPPKTLGDVVYVANVLAGGHFAWLMQEQDAPVVNTTALEGAFAHLKPEIDALTQELSTSCE